MVYEQILLYVSSKHLEYEVLLVLVASDFLPQWSAGLSSLSHDGFVPEHEVSPAASRSCDFLSLFFSPKLDEEK